MAYKLIWSPASRDDLHDIVRFISRDSSQRAEAFGYRLIAETDKLQHSRRLDELSLNTTSQLFVRLLFDPTGLCTASITSAGLSRSRESGIRPEALPICRHHSSYPINFRVHRVPFGRLLKRQSDAQGRCFVVQTAGEHDCSRQA